MSQPSHDNAAATRAAAEREARLAAWARWRDRIYTGYAIGVGLAITAAFLESFHNQIAWFQSVGMHGFYGWIAPAMIDVFILGGEALLLVAVMEHWDWRPKTAAWISIIAGLTASIAANLGAADLPVTPHGATAAAAIAALKTATQHMPLRQMLSFAAAPVALAGLTALGLMIVKRAFRVPDDEPVSGVSAEQQQALILFAGHVRDGQEPTIREIITAFRGLPGGGGCGQPKATRIQLYLRHVIADFSAPDDGAGGQERVS